jgi:hypothetical protein
MDPLVVYIQAEYLNGFFVYNLFTYVLLSTRLHAFERQDVQSKYANFIFNEVREQSHRHPLPGSVLL